MNRFFLITVSLLTLSACGLPGNSTDHATLYTVYPVEKASSSIAHPPSVLVEMPTVPSWLDRERIALATSPNRQDYFADMRWSEALSNMVQDTMIASLEQSGRWIALSQRSSINADYRLVLEVRHFEADYTHGSTPVIHVAITASLINNATQQRMASKIFSADSAAGKNGAQAIISAFNSAFLKDQRAILSWLTSLL